MGAVTISPGKFVLKDGEGRKIKMKYVEDMPPTNVIGDIAGMVGVFEPDGILSHFGPAAEALTERVRQIAKGYTPEHDDAEGIWHIGREIRYRIAHGGEASSPEAVRQLFIEVAAMAIAGVEVLDRLTPSLTPIGPETTDCA